MTKLFCLPDAYSDLGGGVCVCVSVRERERQRQRQRQRQRLKGRESTRVPDLSSLYILQENSRNWHWQAIDRNIIWIMLGFVFSQNSLKE